LSSCFEPLDLIGKLAALVPPYIRSCHSALPGENGTCKNRFISATRWFTEGFDTAGLKAAKALLDLLA
jgi:hypothetical protein